MACCPPVLASAGGITGGQATSGTRRMRKRSEEFRRILRKQSPRPPRGLSGLSLPGRLLSPETPRQSGHEPGTARVRPRLPAGRSPVGGPRPGIAAIGRGGSPRPRSVGLICAWRRITITSGNKGRPPPSPRTGPKDGGVNRDRVPETSIEVSPIRTTPGRPGISPDFSRVSPMFVWKATSHGVEIMSESWPGSGVVPVFPRAEGRSFSPPGRPRAGLPVEIEIRTVDPTGDPRDPSDVESTPAPVLRSMVRWNCRSRPHV